MNNQEEKILCLKIINLYKSGVSLSEAARKLNVSRSWALYHCTKHFHAEFVEIKTKKIAINENYFDKIDSEDKAYFLGFIAADGCVSDRGSLNITLQRDDVEILEKFKKYIGSDHKITFSTVITPAKYESKQARLHICRRKITDSLNKLNITPRKSLTYIPHVKGVPKKLFHHFIRGYFDGDGGISIGRPDKRYFYQSAVSFTGTKETLSIIEKFLTDQNPNITFTWDKRIKDSSNCYTISTHGNGKTIECAKVLYKNANIYLSRKARLMLDIINFRYNKIANTSSQYLYITKYPSDSRPWYYCFNHNGKKYCGYGKNEIDCKKKLNIHYKKICGVNLGFKKCKDVFLKSINKTPFIKQLQSSANL